MIQQHLKTALTLSLSSALLLLNACSKKDDAPGASTSEGSNRVAELSPVRSHAILEYLPESALGFYLVDYTLDSAKAYTKSVWSAKDTSIAESARKLLDQNSDTDQALRIVSALEQQGLLPSTASNTKAEQVLVVIGLDSSTPGVPRPQVSVLESFSNGLDTAKALEAAKADLSAKGVAIQNVAMDGGTGFSSEILLFKDKEKGTDVKTTITITGKGTRLVLSTSPSQVSTEFLSNQPSASKRFATIKADPEYQKAAGQLSPDRSEFSYGYLDVRGGISQIISAIPEAADKKAELDKLPLRIALVSRAMGQGLNDRGIISLTPNTAGVAAELAKTSPTNYAAKLPVDLVGFLSIDGSLIRALAQTASENIPGDKPAQIDSALKQIKSVSEIGLALRPAKGASPLPELAFVISSTDAPAMLKTISDAVTSGTKGQGFLTPFQKKDVQGMSVEYAVSPFGAGVFLGATPSEVIVSSSEGILSDILSAGKGGANSVSGLSKANQELLSGASSLLALQVNYGNVAKLVEGLSSSLGIFTGGQPLMEQKELDRIKSLGQTAATVNFAADAITFLSRTEPAAEIKG